MGEFRFAARIMGRVVCRPDARTAIGDAPIDAIGAPNGLPTLDGARATRIDHHGVTLAGDRELRLRIGERFFLIIHQQDVTTNRQDRHIGVRGGVVETVFEAPARGCVH